MASISVKVPVIKLRAALVARVAALKVEIKEWDAKQALYEEQKTEHQKATVAWQKACLKLLVKTGKREEGYVCLNTAYTNATCQITYQLPMADVPPAPVAPVQPRNTWACSDMPSLAEQVSEIENAIRLLDMTDETMVNTSTYKAVTRYL